jgi:hypothetical protein
LLQADVKKREDEVRALAREPQNKYCFDCGKQGPQFNVVVDLSVFVCQDCAGIHRAYGHKAKNISMTAFSEKVWSRFFGAFRLFCFSISVGWATGSCGYPQWR